MSYIPKAAWPTQITVNGALMSFDHFRWHANCRVIETPSFTSGGKMEHAAGMVSGGASFGGTVSAGFNPSGNGMSPRNVVPVVFDLKNGQVAADDDAIIESFEVSGDAGGPQSYEVSIVFNFNFTNFANLIVGN